MRFSDLKGKNIVRGSGPALGADSDPGNRSFLRLLARPNLAIRCWHGVCGPLTCWAEAMETTKVHSVAGLLSEENGLVAVRPFRAPHHTIYDGLIGGGNSPRTGRSKPGAT